MIKRLGILGGGQLARMLSDAALRQGVHPVLLASAKEAPEIHDPVEVIRGELDDDEAIVSLLGRVDAVTIENEFVAPDRLRRLALAFPDLTVRPAPDGLETTNDKLAQKQLLDRLGIAHAPHRTIHGATLERDHGEILRAFPEGFVLKWSRFGYDGRGVLLVPDAGGVALDEIRDFCSAGEAAGAVVFAEARVPFVSELAMVSTRGSDGTQRFFPLVMSVQEDGICREVIGPASAYGAPETAEARAREILGAIAEELDWCGTFAVEFFLTEDGRLLVNEMAPRVHNSGHFSLHGGEPSQFDLHVQAVTGRPLDEPAIHGIALMRNLIVPADLSGAASVTDAKNSPPPEVALHWYGKEHAFPGRKMGHLTARAASVEEAAALRDAMREHEARCFRA